MYGAVHGTPSPSVHWSTLLSRTLMKTDSRRVLVTMLWYQSLKTMSGGVCCNSVVSFCSGRHVFLLAKAYVLIRPGLLKENNTKFQDDYKIVHWHVTCIKTNWEIAGARSIFACIFLCCWVCRVMKASRSQGFIIISEVWHQRLALPNDFDGVFSDDDEDLALCLIEIWMKAVGSRSRILVFDGLFGLRFSAWLVILFVL